MPAQDRSISPQETLAGATRHLQAGRLREAEGLCRRVLDAQPDHPDALHLLGMVAARSGQPSAAVELIQRAIAGDGRDPAYHLHLGAALQALGRQEEAAAAYRDAVRIKPDFARARYNLGNALQALGRLDEAVSAYRRCLELQPAFAQAQVNLGSALEALGRPEDAGDAYRAALKIDPAVAQAHLNLGGVLEDQGRLDQAVAAYRRAVELQPGFAEAHYNLGGALRALGHLGDSVAAYGRAIALRPNLAQAHSNLGYVLQELGRVDEAIESCQRATGCDPNFPGGHSNLGDALREAGQLDAAAAAYEQAVQLQPDFAEAWTNLGAVYRGLGRFDEAVAAHRRAIARRPGFVEAYVNLCIAWLDQRDPAAALRTCEDYLARAPGNARVLALKAVALDELGDRAAARALVDFDRFIQPVRFETLAGFDSLTAFNAALAAHIRAHPTLVYSPTSHATRHGRHSGELLAGDKGPMAALEAAIDGAVRAYIGDLPGDPEHPFLAEPPRRWRLTAWAVVMESQGHQVPHIHPAWLSGVYYVELPGIIEDADAERAGWIEFGRPGLQVPYTVDPEVRAIKPEEGLMVLFPSYFYHRTIPFEGAEERICVAFDVLPEE